MEARYDPMFAKRYAKIFFPPFLTILITFFLFWSRMNNQGNAVMPLDAELGLVFAFVQVFVGYELLRRRYRCPECGERIRKWHELEPDYFVYRCADCRIEWRVWLGFKTQKQIERERKKIERDAFLKHQRR